MNKLLLAGIVVAQSFLSSASAQQQVSVVFTCHAQGATCYFSIYRDGGTQGTQNFTLGYNQSATIPQIILGQDWYAVALNYIPPVRQIPVNGTNCGGDPGRWCKGPQPITSGSMD